MTATERLGSQCIVNMLMPSIKATRVFFPPPLVLLPCMSQADLVGKTAQGRAAQPGS